MKNILILHFHNHMTQPRVRREYDLLEKTYKLCGLGYVDCKRENVEFVTIKKPKWNWKMKLIQRFWLSLRRYEKVYWDLPQIKEAEERLKTYDFDVIIAHNEETLPLALRYKKNAKVIANMHEYAPKEFERFFWWRIFFTKYKDYLCKTYLKQCDYVYTVCERYAQEYIKNYNIKCGVITSAAKYHLAQKDFLKVDDKKIKMIHHGLVSPDREIHKMIEMMDFVDERFTLDLMLVQTIHMKYYQKLQDMVKSRKNVKIIPPVSFNEIIPFTSKYDVGIFLVRPTTYNLLMCLPNKFFEFIQARLMIAIGPSPEMERYVKKYNLGIVAKDFTPQSMAKELNKLTKEKIIEYKKNADNTAREINAENEGKRMLEMLNIA